MKNSLLHARSWLRALPGAVAGLFVARAALEAAGRPWPGLLVVTVGLLAALGGLALGRWLAGRAVRLWPALILLVYVAWPQRDLGVAASVGLLAALTWLLASRRSSLPRWAPTLADGLTFALALAVYAATAARDVLPADAGEFQLVAARLGVAHPPGYPFYTLVGALFVRLLPLGNPAYALNLLSALLAAGTLVLLSAATRRWARTLGAAPTAALAGGLAAALTLGTATTFWAQATIANIRIPTVFFAALALNALSRFAAAEGPRQADRALVLLALALGLGLGHHPSLAFVALFFLAYVLLTDPRLARQPRRWWKPALVGAVSLLLPFAYLPIRGAMDAVLAPPGLDTLDGFLWHVLARGFSGDMFAFANATDLPNRLALLPTLFSFQFNGLLLIAALLGLLALLWRDWRLFVLLAGSLALHTFVTITYRAPQTVEYLMPAYLPLAIAVGLLANLHLPLISASPRPRVSASPRPRVSPSPRLLIPASPRPRVSASPRLLVPLALWATLLNGWAHGSSFVELAQDTRTRETVAPLLETAPPATRILADWHWATPMWYLQQVEGLRPDVEVEYVYPVIGEEYSQTWRRRVEESGPDRPLLLTHFYEFSGYTTEPWESGFLLRPRPATAPAAPLTPSGATFGEQVRLVGFDLVQETLHAGQVAEFVLAWQPTAPLAAAPSFTLRLVDGSGREQAQADRWLGSDCAPQEVCFVRLFLPIYPNLPAGAYHVTLGAYTVDESGFHTLPTADGQPARVLTDLELQPRMSNVQPLTSNLQLPTSNFLEAVYDRSIPETLRVYLTWRGPLGEGLQARLRTADGAEATAPLPSLPAGACQTVLADLPGAARGPLELALLDGTGQEQPLAGPWGWALTRLRLPAAPADARFVPLGDEVAVVGVRARPAGAGQTMTVDVSLLSLRPLVSDDGISVRLVSADGQLIAAHDSQPALGAVPTLKWIGGSRVSDRHLLPVPEDFAGGEIRATLLAYDNFRLAPLLPLDNRFGEVPLGTWEMITEQ